jgi:hypothetical protein
VRTGSLPLILADRLFYRVAKTGLFGSFAYAKWLSLGLLLVSYVNETLKLRTSASPSSLICMMSGGLVLFFGGTVILYLIPDPVYGRYLYIFFTSLGYLLIRAAGSLLFREGSDNSDPDIFNLINQTFPQEERLLDNEYSINLPATYSWKGKTRKSWINIINPFRALLVVGSPGAGKSFFVIRQVIRQQISKGFTAFIYDFKFDDLSRLAYNYMIEYSGAFPVQPQFCLINFDDLSRTQRCNPLDPQLMQDITDAFESARTILLGLNREWIRRQGDFWVESPIIFLTAIIWFLRKFGKGEYCTLPHAIELMQVDYSKLFSILRLVPEVELYINPFITAYVNDAMEQLEGQIAGAKISMARLSSPQLYYIMTGNDFTLDINNPHQPKILCAGNNPLKADTHGAVLSLYINRLIRLVNRRGGLKCSLIFDEFPTVFLNNIDHLIATGRSSKVATILAVQDQSQLRKDYGKEQADVIMNIAGNIICGQVMGETAEQLSRRFGRINQEKESFSVHSRDTTVSRSKQLEAAVPPSAISSLSAGEFVGMVADDPDRRIRQKFFHATFATNAEQLKREDAGFKPIPLVREVSQTLIMENYALVKDQVASMVQGELERMMNTPELMKLIIRKRNPPAYSSQAT